jgi:hypothetical protein
MRRQRSEIIRTFSDGNKLSFVVSFPASFTRNAVSNNFGQFGSSCLIELLYSLRIWRREAGIGFRLPR